MRTQLAIAGLVAGVLVIAAGGVAVNAATLNAVPVGSTWHVPNPVSDDRGTDATPAPSPSASSSSTPTPSASPSVEPGDDGLPRHSGQDDPATHDVGDDHGGGSTAPVPVPAPATSNSGSGNSGSGGSNSSNSGSGSSNSGSGSGSSNSNGGHGGDDSGGGHGGSGRDD